MSVFLEKLRALAPDPSQADGREWIFVPYDQLTDEVGPLASRTPESSGIVLVETLWKPRQRPYHKQKLALVIASQRHFALEQAARGVAVEYVVGEASYAELLDEVIASRGPLQMMEPAERELRENLAPLFADGRIERLPNETWLTSRDQFERSAPTRAGTPPWKMDRFYRTVRKHTDILMEGGKPSGGKWSFDVENRKKWPGDPPAPTPPVFPVDAVKEEAVKLVEEQFGDHPGELDATQLPASRDDAETLWQWALEHCLPLFGPYEDAMSTASASLFHSRASALINNGRLLPGRVVDDVLALDIPIASKEGFVRQVLGWREFMHHVHELTDGFRDLPEGWKTNTLGADEPLPPAFWGEPSGLHCLDHVIEEVWRTGYGHHITRLMVLSNLATLLGIDPRQVSDWFWVAYTDAYDWVVEPNVLGMGTYSLGDLFVTKPYVSGAAYIHKMSDYCGSCAFSPKKDCPITSLYWDFLARNEEALSDNVRLAMPLRSLSKRAPEKRTEDRTVRDWVVETLRDGRTLDPKERP